MIEYTSSEIIIQYDYKVYVRYGIQNSLKSLTRLYQVLISCMACIGQPNNLHYYIYQRYLLFFLLINPTTRQLNSTLLIPSCHLAEHGMSRKYRESRGHSNSLTKENTQSGSVWNM